MTKQKQVKRQKYPLHGWLNLDKSYDLGSTQAVGAVKRILSPKKIGHAGTLDPLATGVLPLALGDATKTVQYMMDARKIYRFTVRFGIQTDTDDIEGDVIARSDMRPEDAAIQACLPNYIGNIEQLPPRYSAIKVNGQRAYDLARAGQEVELKPRQVSIMRFELIERIDAEHAIFEVECGKGTYVRSLARDMSEALGTCGHISALRRLAVGSFHVDDAITLDMLEKSAIQGHPSTLEGILHPIERALDDIPAVTLDHTQSQRLRHGQSCFVSPAAFQHGGEGSEDMPALYKALQGKRLVALVNRNSRHIAPLRVFN